MTTQTVFALVLVGSQLPHGKLRIEMGSDGTGWTEAIGY